MKEGVDLFRGSAGTHHFMAPEVAKKVKEEGYSGKKADVWSMGCCLYTMAYLETPFKADSIYSLFKTIAEGQ